MKISEFESGEEYEEYVKRGISFFHDVYNLGDMYANPRPIFEEWKSAIDVMYKEIKKIKGKE